MADPKRQAAGKKAANKGKKAQRDVVNYLLDRGLPARNVHRTGWDNGSKSQDDEGDVWIKNPRTTLQVKDYNFGNKAQTPSDLQVEQWMSAARAQALVNDDSLPLLVVKRSGKSDPAYWYSYWYLVDLVLLMAGTEPSDRDFHFYIVHMRFSDTADILLAEKEYHCASEGDTEG